MGAPHTIHYYYHEFRVSENGLIMLVPYVLHKGHEISKYLKKISLEMSYKQSCIAQRSHHETLQPVWLGRFHSLKALDVVIVAM